MSNPSSPPKTMTNTSHSGLGPNPHETGLEVTLENGIEVKPPQSNLEVSYMNNPQPAVGQWAHWNEEAVTVAPKQIFGLARQTFWLLIVLAIVVIAAAVGGGVGGSIAVQKGR
jgi:hypothetical protein